MNRRGVADLIYALLLRALLSHATRIRFETEMRDVFRDVASQCRRSHPLTGSLRALLAELPGLVSLAVQDRSERSGFNAHQPAHFTPEPGMLHGIATDVRHVVRTLRRSTAFTAVAVLSLGLGIGANTATYGVIRQLLLAPLPVASPDELRVVAWRRDVELSRVSQSNSSQYEDPETGAVYGSNVSWPLYRALRDARAEGVTMSAFTFLRGATIRSGSNPAIIVSGILADGNYFATVQPRMALGRTLSPADDMPDAPLVVVLSHELWQRAFGGDSAVLGRVVRLNGEVAQVVGVTERGFRGMSIGGFFPHTDITIPLAAQPRVAAQLSKDTPAFSAADLLWLRVIARVPSVMTVAQLEQSFTAAFRAVSSPVNEGDGMPATVRLLDGSRGAEPLRGESVTLLYMLAAVTVFILLIACTNLSSLMLARGVSRQRETAVRIALGGGRARLLRAMLLESLVLGFCGTILGLLLTVVTRTAFASMLGGVVGIDIGATWNSHSIADPAVLGASAFFGLAAGLLATVLPAFRLLRQDPASNLSQRSNAAATPRLRQGRALIALQIAITLPLVIGAALFLRTLSNLGHVPLGFDPSGVAVFRVNPEYTGLANTQHSAVYGAVLRKLRAIPGVTSASLMENALLSGIVSNTSVSVSGITERLYLNAVGPDIADVLGLRVVAGRMPGIGDVETAPRVGAVNEAAVSALFAGQSPIGRTLRVNGQDVTIIGVVSDTRYQSQRDSVAPTLYDAALQRAGWGGHHVVLRAAVPLASLEREIREAVASVHPDMPVPSLRSQLDIIDASKAREKLFAQALTFSGLLALVLACIGLYGVTAYSVARRTNEIGVRVAVGAMPRQVLWLVLRQVVVLAAAGVLVGLPLALASTRLVRGMLYGVAPTDALTIVAASLGLLVVAAMAGAIPAWRASRLDAMTALRTE